MERWPRLCCLRRAHRHSLQSRSYLLSVRLSTLYHPHCQLAFSGRLRQHQANVFTALPIVFVSIDVANKADLRLFFFFRNAFKNIDYSPYLDSGQWYITKSEVEMDFFRSTTNHTELEFPAINYHIHIQRKPLYNTIYMAFPSLILSLVALLMFWLPPESGEKVSLGITVFLAFAVIVSSLSDKLPESSNSFPILGKWQSVFQQNKTDNVQSL